MNLNEMNEEEQIEYVQEKFWNIGDIDDSSELVQFAAVTKFLNSITFIENPTENVQLYVVKQSGRHIRFIINNLGKNPSIKVQNIATKQNHRSIIYISNPTKKIQKNILRKHLYTIYENAFNIKNNYFIKKPSYKSLMKWID